MTKVSEHALLILFTSIAGALCSDFQLYIERRYMSSGVNGCGEREVHPSV